MGIVLSEAVLLNRSAGTTLTDSLLVVVMLQIRQMDAVDSVGMGLNFQSL